MKTALLSSRSKDLGCELSLLYELITDISSPALYLSEMSTILVWYLNLVLLVSHMHYSL